MNVQFKSQQHMDVFLLLKFYPGNLSVQHFVSKFNLLSSLTMTVINLWVLLMYFIVHKLYFTAVSFRQTEYYLKKIFRILHCDKPCDH